MAYVNMWTNEDTYNWAVSEARREKLYISDRDLQNFRQYSGEELMSFEPRDFVTLTEIYGIFFYERFHELLQEQGLYHQSPNYQFDAKSDSTNITIGYPSTPRPADDDNDDLFDLPMGIYEDMKDLNCTDLDQPAFLNLITPSSSSSSSSWQQENSSSSSSSWQQETSSSSSSSSSFHILTPLDSSQLPSSSSFHTLTPLDSSQLPSSSSYSSSLPPATSSCPGLYNPYPNSSSASPPPLSPPSSPSVMSILDELDGTADCTYYMPGTPWNYDNNPITPPEAFPPPLDTPAVPSPPRPRSQARSIRGNSPSSSDQKVPRPLHQIQTSSRSRLRGPSNWEFLMRLLADDEYNPSLVAWVCKAQWIFKLNQPAVIAKMFGERTRNRNTGAELTYDNFARGLRYHYGTGALHQVPEHQLMYKCGKRAIAFLNKLEASRRT